MIKVGIGQDSHRFDKLNEEKKLVLGGVVIKDAYPLLSNSDGDVILHAITNAVSGITGVNILGSVADRMCEEGITDSREYLLKALEFLNEKNYEIFHLSISVECKIPRLSNHIERIRKSIANIIGISYEDVGITVTSGEELTSFGKEEGIQAIAVVTAMKKNINISKN